MRRLKTGAAGRSRAAALACSAVALCALAMPPARAALVSANRSSAPHAWARHAPRRASGALLQQLTLSADGAATTLTLRLSAAVPARLQRLHRPERLLLVLPHTRRSAALAPTVPIGAVTALRSASSPHGDLRLV